MIELVKNIIKMLILGIVGFLVFKEFLDEHRDEISALQVLNSRPYAKRLTYRDVKELAEDIRSAQDPEIELMTGWLEAWGEDVNDLAFLDDRLGVAIGSRGRAWITNDGGEMWLPTFTNTSRNLNALHFFDGQKGWAVGDGGTLAERMERRTEEWAARGGGASEGEGV